MRAINYAARSGVTCVASAGNQGQEKIVYPAAFGNTIGVASTTVNDEVSLFSNLGNDLVTVAAPGEAVVTTFPGGGWALASGTSFAAPWISGAAAIFADKNGREHQPGRADFFLASEALTHAAAVQGHGAGRAGHGRADLEEAVDKLKDHVEMGTTGQSDYPYLILVEFAEGCSVAYPPAAFGGGCDAQVAAQLEVDGDEVELEITNAGGEIITVSSIEISWPAAHEDLEKIKLNGAIFEEDLRSAVRADRLRLEGSGQTGESADRAGRHRDPQVRVRRGAGLMIAPQPPIHIEADLLVDTGTGPRRDRPAPRRRQPAAAPLPRRRPLYRPEPPLASPGRPSWR